MSNNSDGPETVNNLRAKAAEYNPRKISKTQAENLAKSMATFGDLSGIVENQRTGRLIGGHQRVKQLDASWPVVVKEKASDGKMLDSTGTVARGYIDTPSGQWSWRLVDWDEQKEKAANIAANAAGGEFDYSKLPAMVAEFDKTGFDVSLLCLDDLDNILDSLSADAITEEEVPEKPATPVTSRGDLWTLGDHRLLCGDATDPASYKAVLAGRGEGAQAAERARRPRRGRA